MSDPWLMVAWASTGFWTSVSDLPCSASTVLVGCETPPWVWLTVVWACGVGSLDGPEELSRPRSGGLEGLSRSPSLGSSMEDISKREIARKPQRIKYQEQTRLHCQHASPRMAAIEPSNSQ